MWNNRHKGQRRHVPYMARKSKEEMACFLGCLFIALSVLSGLSMVLECACCLI